MDYGVFTDVVEEIREYLEEHEEVFFMYKPVSYKPRLICAHSISANDDRYVIAPELMPGDEYSFTGTINGVYCDDFDFLLSDDKWVAAIMCSLSLDEIEWIKIVDREVIKTMVRTLGEIMSDADV